MEIRFSIIVPVFNVAQYLDEAIRSVVDQSYTQWELILVDDGSTDSSPEIITAWKLKEPRIKSLLKTNGGQASARNMGIRHAKYEYIAFLDADDLYLQDKLLNQVILLNNLNPDFLFGLGYHYYEFPEKKIEPYDWVTGKLTGKEMFQILYHSNSVNTNTVVLKKKWFDEAGYFDEDPLLRGTEDWDLWLRLSKIQPVFYGAESRDVYYRVHSTNITSQRARMKIGRWKILEKYDLDPEIHALVRKREYRYTFRELMNFLLDEGRLNEIPLIFKVFRMKDRSGLGTFLQHLILPLFPLRTFMWISNKIIYRFAYRIEKMNYKIKGI